MDLRTGEIRKGNKDEFKKLRHMLEISEQDMTEKQKIEKKVFLKDHRSKLGKKLTEKRRELGYTEMTRNQQRNIRNRLRGNRK